MSRLREEYPVQAAIELNQSIEEELGDLIPRESYIGVAQILTRMEEKHSWVGGSDPEGLSHLMRWEYSWEEENLSQWELANTSDDLTILCHRDFKLAYLFMKDPNLAKYFPKIEQQDLSRFKRAWANVGRNVWFIIGIFWAVGSPSFLFIPILLSAGVSLSITAITLLLCAPVLVIPAAIVFGYAMNFLRELYRNIPVTVKDHANAYAKTQGLPPISKIGMFKSNKFLPESPPSYQESLGHNGKRKDSIEPPPYKNSSSFIAE